MSSSINNVQSNYLRSAYQNFSSFYSSPTAFQIFSGVVLGSLGAFLYFYNKGDIAQNKTSTSSKAETIQQELVQQDDLVQSPKTPLLKGRWTTAFTPNAKKLGVDEKIEEYMKKRNIHDFKDTVTSYENVTPFMERNQTSHVGWDRGTVTEVGKEKNPSTRELSVCLAILGRGYKEGNSEPTHLGLHHLSYDPEKFKETLSLLVSKIQKGTIEIFITSGELSSIPNYKRALEIIQECKTESCDIVIKEDLFRIADTEKKPVVVTTKHYHFMEKPGIGAAGFDAELNPFQTITVSKADKALSEPDIEEIAWY